MLFKSKNKILSNLLFLFLYQEDLNKAATSTFSLQLFLLVSLHIRSMWETTVMHKQVSGWTVNFGPNFPEYPFLELKTRIPPLPISDDFRFGMTKVYPGIPPPPFWKTSDLGWPKFTLEYPPPHFGKLQIWADQSLLRNTPPHILENFRFGMTKVYSGIPPPPNENCQRVKVRESKSEIFRIPRVTTCGDFIQPG